MKVVNYSLSGEGPRTRSGNAKHTINIQRLDRLGLGAVTSLAGIAIGYGKGIQRCRRLCETEKDSPPDFRTALLYYLLYKTRSLAGPIHVA